MNEEMKTTEIGELPVPPAGDVEVLAWHVDDGTRHKTAFVNDPTGWAHGYKVTELVDRAHVTRLTTERDTIDNDFIKACNYASDVEKERDALKAEVERLKALPHGQILAEAAGRHLLNSGAENFIGDVFTIEADDGTTKFEVVVTTQKVGAKSPGEKCNELQSELTKAREFLVHIKKCLIKNKEYAPLSHQELDGLIGHSPSASCRNECRCLWCHQSVPAASLIERGSTHGFEQSPNTCRHDEKSGVWWREGNVTRTGRECNACGHVDEDAPAAKVEGDE